MTFEATPFPLEKCEPRPKTIRNAHIGVHPQKQDGKFYIGVVLSVGKLVPEQMRKLADLSRTLRQPRNAPDGLAKPAHSRH